MAEKIEIRDGSLSWEDQTVDGLSFIIEIEKDASILIRFDPLGIESSEDRQQREEITNIVQEAQFSRSRLMRKFEIEGTSNDGVDVRTSHGRVADGATIKLGGSWQCWTMRGGMSLVSFSSKTIGFRSQAWNR